MKYLQITNDTEISIHALTLMGASTKTGQEGQIGFFGTGNKYALACLLREGHEVQIYSGKVLLQLSTVPTRMGEATFDVVCINGTSTSITTRMGPTWKRWQAIRELYSNAIDCGGEEIAVVEEPTTIAGKTQFLISLDSELQAIVDEWPRYFSKGREPLFQNERGAIYPGNGAIYRHGIRCNRIEGQSGAFDYELGDLSITEERLFSRGWEVSRTLWDLIFTCDSTYIIRSALDSLMKKETVESRIFSSSDFERRFSQTALDFFGRTMIHCESLRPVMSKDELVLSKELAEPMFNFLRFNLPEESLMLPRSVSSKGMAYLPIDGLDEQLEAKLQRCLDRLRLAGVRIDQAGIRFGKFPDPSVKGWADLDNNRMVLAHHFFAVSSDQDCIATLLEEEIHLATGANDRSAEFQEAAILRMAQIVVTASDAVERLEQLPPSDDYQISFDELPF